MKGATPQWQHFSLQTFVDAFWRLLNCTWYRQDPFSFKSKTDCFSLGRRIIGQEKWQSRDCPALWEVEDRGGELVHSVLMCVNSFSVFVFCTTLSCKKIMFVPMCFKSAHIIQPPCIFFHFKTLSFVPSLSHIHTSLSLILASPLSYPASTSPSVALLTWLSLSHSKVHAASTCSDIWTNAAVNITEKALKPSLSQSPSLTKDLPIKVHF